MTIDLQTMLERLDLGAATTRLREEPPVFRVRAGQRSVIVAAFADRVTVSTKVADRVPEPRAAGLRQLLQGNVRLGGSFFTVEKNGAVNLNHILPSGNLRDEHLAGMLRNVAARGDEWAAKLASAPGLADPGALVQGILDRLGVDWLARELDRPPVFGGRGVQLHVGDGYLIMTARVAEARAASLSLYEKLLGGDPDLRGAYFTRDPDGAIRLNHVLLVSSLSDTHLDLTLGNFVARASEWRARLAEGAP